MQTTLVIDDVVVFDGERHAPNERRSVALAGERIAAIEPAGAFISSVGDQATVLSGNGMTLMPGLIDAHFHCNSPSLSVSAAGELTSSHQAQYARRYLENMLLRGFTTLRDAGGANRGLVQAIEDGLIKGPRLLISGKALSQTGGHGHRRSGASLCGCHGNTGSLSSVVDDADGVVDGADDVRRNVREQLRLGVHQIKLFVSGGILSPNDPVWMDPFTDDEIRAAVEEAALRRSYVMAHSLTARSAQRCAELGVRSIEHGFGIDQETARFVADSESYVTATLGIVHWLLDEDIVIPSASREKLQRFGDETFDSLRFCHDAGVKVGLGTDMLGGLHGREAQEFLLREEVSGALETLRSATSINAELIALKGEIGVIRPRAVADLLLVAGDPVRDISLLARPESAFKLIIKGGEVIKNTLAPPNESTERLI